MSFLAEVLASQKEAPSGATVKYQGDTYKKGFTDQPTWFPQTRKSGLIAVIPSEDEEEYAAIEKAYADQNKPKKPEPKLSAEDQKRVDSLTLKLLKSPSSQRAPILEKIEKIKSRY